MPRASKNQLLEQFVRAAERGGWTVNPIGLITHPFRLYLYREGQSISVLLYIWNISHGGKNRPDDEYRIQITGVNSLEDHSEFKTLILGWWEEQDVFAAWDINFHAGDVPYSPSFQIRREYLLAALAHDFAVCPKGQGELAVAFSPDFLVTYCRNAEALHAAGKLSQDVDALMQIANTGAIDEVDLAPLPAERQKVVRTFSQHVRESSFRKRILNAYNASCAMCGMQLNLVEAAHIVPVYDPNSTDETNNGLCLCSLHHRALDRSLVAVAPNYDILFNDKEIERLYNKNLSNGESLLRNQTAPTLILPTEPIHYPKTENLKLALQIRRWPEDDENLLKETT